MHLKSLKVFCDVVGRKSFSRAADENGITQSGASQMVHHLEEHLGVRLLDRSKRPFVLTQEGKVYYQGCRKLVQRFQALEEEVQTLHQEVAGRVAIASIYSVGLTYLNDLIEKFSARHPKANMVVGYYHPHRVYELVEQDQVDLGMVSYPRSSRSIKGIEWRREPVILVCSPQHPWAGRSDVCVTDLNDLELIGFDGNLKIRQEFDRSLAAVGVELRVAMEFDNTETIKRAVQVNQGISLLPEPTVTGEIAAGTLRQVAVESLDLWRPVGLIKRRGIELGKTARRFVQLVQEQSEAGSSPAAERRGSSRRPLLAKALDGANGSHPDPGEALS